MKTRRELLKLAGFGLAGLPFGGFGVGQDRSGRRFSVPPGAAYQGTDEQLLDDIQRGAFEFFWNESSAKTGQTKDRALAAGSDTRTMSSIAATGFGLTALCIGDRRGYAKTSDIITRVRNTLQFIYQQMPNVHGFYYHFVDMNTGQRWAQSELSSI